ncbi:MAG: hypothetical protein U0232_19260 [Thermomicrobiales bacterium]
MSIGEEDAGQDATAEPSALVVAHPGVRHGTPRGPVLGFAQWLVFVAM